jgi:hypothetical protein
VDGNISVNSTNDTMSSSAFFGGGFDLSAFATTGSIHVSMNGANASGNITDNIGMKLETSNGDITLTVLDSTFNGSTSGSGFDVIGTASGNIDVTVTGNYADQNNVNGIDLDLTSTAGNIGMNVSTNVATNTAGNSIADDNDGDGILINALATSGNITALVDGNGFVNSNNEDGIDIDLEAGADLTLTVSNNIVDINTEDGIDVSYTAGGTADVTITNNGPDGNGGVGISLLGTSGDTATIFVTNNVTDNNSLQGTHLNVTATGGNLNLEVSGNEGLHNNDENFLAELETSTGNITIDILDNTFTGSNTENGLDVIAEAGGTGTIDVTVSGNTTISNTEDNIHVDATTNDGDINLNIFNNQASNGLLDGIELDAIASNSGNIFIKIAGNTSENNSDQNIEVDSEAVDGNVTVNATDNQVSGAGAEGIDVTSETTGTGNVDVTISGNTANTNGEQNLDVDSITSGGSVKVLILNNTANDSTGLGPDGIGRGIEVDTQTSGPSGTVDVTISGNAATSNNNSNIAVFSVSESTTRLNILDNTVNNGDSNGIFVESDVTGTGDLIIIVDGNDANNSANWGINVTATATSGLMRVDILDNTATGSGTTNIEMDLESESDIEFKLQNNDASSSTGGLGILVRADVTGEGGIDANVSDNIASNNTNSNGIELDLTSSNDDSAILISGNTSSNNAGTGISLFIDNSGTTGNLDVTMTGNTFINDGFMGVLGNLQSPQDVTLTYSYNVTDTAAVNGAEFNLTVGASDDLVIYGEHNEARHNGSNGIQISVSGSSTQILDFGGGSLSSPGQNSFQDYDGAAGVGFAYGGPGTFDVGTTAGSASFWDEDGDGVGVNPPVTVIDHAGGVNAPMGSLTDPNP